MLGLEWQNTLSLLRLKFRVIFSFQAPLLIRACFYLEDTIFAGVVLFFGNDHAFARMLSSFLVMTMLLQGCFRLLHMPHSTHGCTSWPWGHSWHPCLSCLACTGAWETERDMAKHVWQCSCVFEGESNLHVTVRQHLRRRGEAGHLCPRHCFPFYYQRRRHPRTDMIPRGSGHHCRHLWKVSNRSILSAWLSLSLGKECLGQT